MAEGGERWRLQSRETLVAEPWFTLHADRVELPDGSAYGPFYLLDGADWVAALAFTTQGDLLLVEQYRYGADGLCLELPGGLIDGGESPEQAAARELLEETGWRGVAGPVLCSGQPSVNRSRNRAYLVLITDATPVQAAAASPHERTKVVHWPRAEAADLLLEPRFGDLAHKGLLAAGLARLHRFGDDE